MPPNHRRLIAIAITIACLLSLAAHASIQFSGLDQVSEADARDILTAQIDLIETTGGSRPLADDASFFLERDLRRRGFEQADVLWKFDAATQQITLIVNEGNRLKLGEITVTGNVANIEPSDIDSLVKRATTNRLRTTILAKQNSLPFVKEDIAAGLADVAQLYRSLGYWDATTAPLEASISTTNSLVHVNLQITPGDLHHFRRFELTEPSEEIQSLLSHLIGQPCTTENVSTARNIVAEFFNQRGYFQNQIDVTPIDHGNEISLVFQIDAGTPFEVANIRVQGNQRVKSEFLEERFNPLVGQPYSPSEVDQIYRQILEIGLFSRISVHPEKLPSSEHSVDLVIDVDESKARSIGLYGGYGNYDGGIIGFIFRENNVFGTGRQFNSSAELTQRGLRGTAEYNDKWFYNTPFFFNAKIFANSEDRDGYSKFEYGGRIELGREITSHYSVTTFATLEHNEITTAEIDAVDLGEQNYRVASVGLAHSWDTRNSPTLPSRGFIFDNTIEYGSALSDIDFMRGTLRLSIYFPITKHSQLSLGARSGFIMPTGDTEDIPIDLRFFSGGSSTVRSFREHHLGPSDRNGYPLGGQFYNTFNAEYTVPLVGDLKAAVFADAGNLLTDFDDASLDEMHYAIGTGLRYDLPTGPIRLDYGWNMNPSKGEPSGTFHVSVGFAF